MEGNITHIGMHEIYFPQYYHFDSPTIIKSTDI